jgi:hypothetical protein
MTELSGYEFSPLRGETSPSTGAPATVWRRELEFKTIESVRVRF